MKVVITTMIWKRPEVTKIWCKAIQRIISSFPDIDFEVVVAGSEGKGSRDLIGEFGFNYIETPNYPLSDKANKRLKACKNYKSDYILFLGSDDFMNNKTFQYILDKMEKGFDEIAPMDLYIYDSISKRMVYSQGYINHRKGERLAIGRALKTSVLDAIGWTMFKGGLNRGLDGSSIGRLRGVIKKPHYYYLKENGLMTIDVKSDTNLSEFNVNRNHTLLDLEKLKDIEEYELIKNLN